MGSGGSDWKPAKSWASGIVLSQTPPLRSRATMQQRELPHPGEYQRLRPLYITGAPRQKKKKTAQMKEQIKAPEKIQLSDKEIVNLSDAQFKTLVIKILTFQSQKWLSMITK